MCAVHCDVVGVVGDVGIAGGDVLHCLLPGRLFIFSLFSVVADVCAPPSTIPFSSICFRFFYVLSFSH